MKRECRAVRAGSTSDSCTRPGWRARTTDACRHAGRRGRCPFVPQLLALRSQRGNLRGGRARRERGVKKVRRAGHAVQGAPGAKGPTTDQRPQLAAQLDAHLHGCAAQVPGAAEPQRAPVPAPWPGGEPGPPRWQRPLTGSRKFCRSRACRGAGESTEGPKACKRVSVAETRAMPPVGPWDARPRTASAQPPGPAGTVAAPAVPGPAAVQAAAAPGQAELRVGRTRQPAPVLGAPVPAEAQSAAAPPRQGHEAAQALTASAAPAPAAAPPGAPASRQAVGPAQAATGTAAPAPAAVQPCRCGRRGARSQRSRTHRVRSRRPRRQTPRPPLRSQRQPLLQTERWVWSHQRQRGRGHCAVLGCVLPGSRL